MKIIHCADLHLDSKLTTHMTKEQAKVRRRELLEAFGDMVNFAADNQVEVIIIAGDLFDRNTVSKEALNYINDVIRKNENIDFLCLKGNHDREPDLYPYDNLYTFSDRNWTRFEYNGVTIAGVILGESNVSAIFDKIPVNENGFNIVVLHGQESEYDKPGDEQVIPLSKLRNKGIDYLALGHVHFFKEAKLDERGTYCYSGCLCGRGFDEWGEHGFVLLDINEKKGTYTSELISVDKRNAYEIWVDVTDANDLSEITELIDREIADNGCESKDLVKICLQGEGNPNDPEKIQYLEAVYGDRFYVLRIKDETARSVRADSYSEDISLKGEFVRLVNSSSLSEYDKEAVIRYGIMALSGEELE